MTYFASFIATVLISVFLTGFLWRYGHKLGLLAQPRQRDVHKNPVPRIGGLGIFGAFLFVSLIVFLVVRPDLRFGAGTVLDLDNHLWGIWLGSFLITAIMLLDDIRGLSTWLKLIAQIFVALVVIGFGIGIESLSNPFGGAINLNSVYITLFHYHGIAYSFSLWSDLLTLVWLVGMMNVINFVDGVDGLAGGQSAIAAFTIFLLSTTAVVDQPATAMISIILCGAALGFLFWNFPPAKIFMGDSGSMFLGFILGTLALISGGKLATILLVLGFPIVDSLIVVGGRLIRGQNPFTTPDKTHLHHRFLAAGFTPRQAILSLYLISAGFGYIALSSSTQGKAVGFVLLILLVLALMVGLKSIEKKHDLSGKK